MKQIKPLSRGERLAHLEELSPKGTIFKPIRPTHLQTSKE
jgi:hypothetical protein